MKNLIKYSAGIISFNNSSEDYCDNYFADGRSKEDSTLNLQVSIEKSNDNCLFCVFDDIKEIDHEGKPQVTLAGEVKKLYERIGSLDRNIDNKLNLMSECIRDTDNLLYSVALGRPANRKGPTAFAGLIFSEHKAAALNIGGNRVCLFRNGALKPMAGDSKKMEKLLKLGIITLDQAKDISPHFGVGGENIKDESPDFEVVDVRAGDVFVLLSGWLANTLEDERLVEILVESENVDKAAAALATEALNSHYTGNITAMVINIEDVSEGVGEKLQMKPKKIVNREPRFSFLPTEKEYRENTKTYIAAVVTSVLIIALLFSAYVLWIKGDKDRQETPGPGSDTNYGDDTKTTTTTEGSSDSDDGSGTENQTGEETSGSEETGGQTGTIDENDTDKTVYTVQSGDSLSSISQRFYGDPNSYDKIMEANDLKNPNNIVVGQKLIIP